MKCEKKCVPDKRIINSTLFTSDPQVLTSLCDNWSQIHVSYCELGLFCNFFLNVVFGGYLLGICDSYRIQDMKTVHARSLSFQGHHFPFHI